MARDYGEDRSERITVRVTAAEKAQVHAAAKGAGMADSEYTRARLGLGSPTSQATAFADVDPLVAEAISGLDEAINNARALLRGASKGAT